MILIICPQFYGVHGIARYVQSYLLARGAHTEKICVMVGDEFATDLTIPNAELICLHMPAGRLGLERWSLTLRSRIKQMAADGQISVINLHIPPLIPGLFMPRVAPIIVTAHTTYVGMSGRFYPTKQFKSQWSNLSIAVKMLFERYIFSKADALLTLTEQGRQELLRYGSQKPIDLVPNGVVLERFSPKADVEKVFDVLFAGRIEQRKGSRPMVSICQLLVKIKPKIKIAIVGVGDDMTYVKEELAPFAEQVTLYGQVNFEQINNIYNKSRIYASPSYYEGLPGTCLEAMSMSLPVVVWDYLFYNEVVRHGFSGIKVTPNDIDGFASAIIELTEDESEQSRLGTNGREIAVHNFSWTILADSLDHIFCRAKDRKFHGLG